MSDHVAKPRQWGNPEQMMFGERLWTAAQLERAERESEEIMKWWRPDEQ